MAYTTHLKVGLNRWTMPNYRQLKTDTINPLITNDAYMRQIIACAEVPMTHICVKDEGTHFHGIFGCCERATALNSPQPIQ